MDLEIRDSFPLTAHRGTLLLSDREKEDGPLTSVSKGNIYGSHHMRAYDTEKRETAHLVKDLFCRSVNGYPATLLGGRKVCINAPGL